MEREKHPAEENGDIRAEKKRIRAEAAERIRRMTAEERRAASEAITREVLASEAYRRAEIIMAFVSMPSEPDTREIIRRAVGDGKKVLLPVCSAPPRMRAALYRGEERMRKGRWGIPEPVSGEDEPFPEPDLILVPCAAAAESGARLGHGGGYYDWFLKDRRGLKVCLCFRAQLFESLPEEETDIPMDRVIRA